MKNIKNVTKILICLLLLFTLVGCGCNKINYKTYADVKDSLDNYYVSGTEEINVKARKALLLDLVATSAVNAYNDYKNTYMDLVKMTEDGKATEIINIGSALSQQLTSLKSANETELEYLEKVSILLGQSLESAKNNAAAYLKPELASQEEGFRNNVVNEIKEKSLATYLVEEAIFQVENSVNKEKYDDYQVMLFEEDQKTYVEKLNNLDIKIDTTKISAEVSYDSLVVEKANTVYSMMEEYTSLLAERAMQPEPIRFELKDFGDFFGNFFDNFFIYPVGLLLMFFSKIFGGKYIVGLLITTLIIRTLGWPIYTKSNDMTLKMKLMEPEQAKIQQKYEKRKDEESQRMMQMEMMQLYKKYGVGLGGCLMPFLQFPIFMAVYRAITRFPYTNGFAGSKDWVSSLDSKVFGIDLFADKSAGGVQLVGIIVLAVLVVGTQVLQQLYSNKKQKEQQEKAQENIPAYRRQAAAQSNGMAQQMKMMMWMMTAMMGMFVFTSKAGLGVYWLIGNIYAIVQQVISNKNSANRLEKLRQKHIK